MKKLLLICTTEVPFRDMDGKMNQQRDGVSMGSPLGPTFANFFMAEVENRALENIDVKPPLYGRYIDDIFTICDEDVLMLLKDEMTLISGMNFTIEKAVDNKLPFLNVLVNKTDGIIKSTVYRKPTDAGRCLNAEGECPDRYKISVVKGFLHRARILCTEKAEMMLEINRSKKILINSGYSNKIVDNEIRQFLKNETKVNQTTTGVTHKVFYRNFMNPKYKQNEQAIKEIIKSYVKVKNSNDRLQIVIFYKSTKTRDLTMKNNLLPKPRELSRTNLTYDFNCTIGECKHLPPKQVRYSGVTTCTLSRRLSYHLQNGAIKNHVLQEHNRNITREEIVSMTKVRYYENDIRRLEILEALTIRFEDPDINKQDTGKKRVLKLYGNVIHSNSS